VSTKVAIILAAGTGERMGGSKALLVVDGHPLAALHVARALEAGCDRAVVVTRPETAARLGEIPRATILAQETAGQAESLQVAARKVGMRGDVRVLVTPVDCPPVSVATINALFAALDDGATVATPHRAGKGGHPVACRATVLAPYASKEETAPPPLRDVLATQETSRSRIEVDDPRVGLDLDTPEDVVAFTGSRPTFA
jgi:molybdenum cofactor cytidylyltransferase